MIRLVVAPWRRKTPRIQQQQQLIMTDLCAKARLFTKYHNNSLSIFVSLRVERSKIKSPNSDI